MRRCVHLSLRPATGMVLALAGCGPAASFPVQLAEGGPRTLAFDIDRDGRDDYWQDVGADGRKVALRFDDDRDGEPDTTVRLETGLAADDLHVVIVLDGVPFDVFAGLYDRGRFRLFAPPSRLISVFPAMTDLALARVFDAGPCLGYEALYYDHARNRLSDGQGVYLSGANAPWTPAVDYRCRTNWDSLAYLDPKAVWRHELEGITRTVAAANDGRVTVYTVATAGLATRGGRQAVVDYLAMVDALCERITYQRRGRVRFTMLADHGHGLTPCRRVSFADALRRAGFRVAKSIKDDRDVVMPAFGLVTSLAVHTRSPQAAADVLLTQEGIDLVMYPAPAEEGPAVVVRSADGEARIMCSTDRATGVGPVRAPVGNRCHTLGDDRSGDDRYIYLSLTGDPLRLLPILDRLRADGLVAGDGSVADRDWLASTADHVYPDPLHRIWSAFQPGDLVENPADLLVSLKEGYACGSKFFAALVKVESTHGSLARGSSTTFMASNAVQLPPALRVDEVSEYLTQPPEPSLALPGRVP